MTRPTKVAGASIAAVTCGNLAGIHPRYKRGSFYPFAPLPGEKRDNALELQVRALVTNDLRLEDDLSRWFPVWGAPGL
nr:hypothetical protein [Streptomyces sp. CBMA29]